MRMNPILVVMMTILFNLCLLVFSPSVASSSLTKDRYLFFDNRINLYDEHGIRKGYLQKDREFKDRINVFDENGIKKGYIKKGKNRDEDMKIIEQMLKN